MTKLYKGPQAEHNLNGRIIPSKEEGKDLGGYFSHKKKQKSHVNNVPKQVKKDNKVIGMIIGKTSAT